MSAAYIYIYIYRLTPSDPGSGVDLNRLTPPQHPSWGFQKHPKTSNGGGVSLLNLGHFTLLVLGWI